MRRLHWRWLLLVPSRLGPPFAGRLHFADAARPCDLVATVRAYEEVFVFVEELESWLRASAPLREGRGEPAELLAAEERRREAEGLLETAETLRLYACAALCAPQRCFRTDLAPEASLGGPAAKARELLARGGDGEPEEVFGGMQKAAEALSALWADFNATRAAWGPDGGAPKSLEGLLARRRDLGREAKAASAATAFSSARALLQPASLPAFEVCSALPGAALRPRKAASFPAAASQPPLLDVLSELLASVGRAGGGLSSLLLAIRPLHADEDCQGAKGLASGLFLDVTKCFQERGDGWDVAVEYHNDGQILKYAWEGRDGPSRTVKELPEPFVDVLWLSPIVGNCAHLEKGLLQKSSQLLPRIAVLPVNPLVPPPFSVVPDHAGLQHKPRNSHGHWYAQCSLVATYEALNKHNAYHLVHFERGLPYAVFVNERFLEEGLLPASAERCADDRRGADHAAGAALLGSATAWGCRMQSLFRAWAEAWLCAPEARFRGFLEGYPNARRWTDLADSARPLEERAQGLCKLLQHLGLPLLRGNVQCPEDGPAVAPAMRVPSVAEMLAVEVAADVPGASLALRASGRGHCLRASGICECFPPWRGHACGFEDPSRGEAVEPKDFAASIVTIIPDSPRYLDELASNLAVLWQQFNRRFDYPVLVFHEGLSGDSRRQLVRASPCRLWFFLLEDLQKLPGVLARDAQERARVERGVHKSLGYRGQARWKAGPMFRHPVFSSRAGLPHYAWWQDYDSYLPAPLQEDPFRHMHEEGVVFAWTHSGKDAKAVTKGFWDATRLYMEERGIRMTQSALLREALQSWNERDGWDGWLIMNDNELMRMDWFKDGPYYEWFEYLDDLHGYWRHRWGDTIVRTFGVGMHLEDSRQQRLELPYAHQLFCLCGGGEPGRQCSRVDAPDRRAGWRWRCS